MSFKELLDKQQEISDGLPADNFAEINDELADQLALITANTNTKAPLANAALTGTTTVEKIVPAEIDLPTATPVNAVAATGTLTLTGVVIDGETVTIGTDTYEFAADVAQTVGVGNIAVDILAFSTASAGTLTLPTQPIAGDTMTIGTKTYTFVPDGTENADGEITIGTDLPTAKTAIVAAINGSDAHNTAHPLVSAAAFAVDDCVITALVGGVAGDLIATTETFDAVGNVFDAATLGTTVAGVDCTAADADGAIILADAGVGYAMAQGAGTTITVTAATRGIAGNDIATTDTMANGAFGAATLAGGVNGTVGSLRAAYTDATYLYVAVAANTIAGNNWRRVALGTAY